MQSQAIQVNLANKGIDFACRVNTCGIQLMMKSAHTQAPLVYVSEASTPFGESDVPEKKDISEEAFASVSSEVSPQKDGTYLPSTLQCLSDDSNISESDDDEEKPKLKNPQDDIKFVVFEQELSKLLKRCRECEKQLLRSTNLPREGSYL